MYFALTPSDRPKKKVPLEISDLGAVTWVKFGDSKLFNEYLIVRINANHSVSFNEIATTYTLEDLFKNDAIYSTDRKTWLPMYKEVYI